MSYENLDRIADSYIPLLILLALIYVFIPQKGCNESILGIMGYKVSRLLGVVVPVYLLMYLDEYFSIWPRFGLDYSTHTALSLALTCFLAWENKRLRVYLSAFFIVYLFLMLYQQYHTVMDIVMTGIVVGALTFMVLRNAPRIESLDESLDTHKLITTKK